MSGLKNRDFEYDSNSDQLFEAVLNLKSVQECENFFRDVMTISELQAVTERFTVARQLYLDEKPYREINKETGVSTATITRIADWIKNGTGGYKVALDRLAKTRHRRRPS